MVLSLGFAGYLHESNQTIESFQQNLPHLLDQSYSVIVDLSDRIQSVDVASMAQVFVSDTLPDIVISLATLYKKKMDELPVVLDRIPLLALEYASDVLNDMTKRKQLQKLSELPPPPVVIREVIVQVDTDATRNRLEAMQAKIIELESQVSVLESDKRDAAQMSLAKDLALQEKVDAMTTSFDLMLREALSDQALSLAEEWAAKEALKYQSLRDELQAQSAKHVKIYDLFVSNVDAMQASLEAAKTGYDYSRWVHFFGSTLASIQEDVRQGKELTQHLRALHHLGAVVSDPVILAAAASISAAITPVSSGTGCDGSQICKIKHEEGKKADERTSKTETTCIQSLPQLQQEYSRLLPEAKTAIFLPADAGFLMSAYAQVMSMLLLTESGLPSITESTRPDQLLALAGNGFQRGDLGAAIEALEQLRITHPACYAVMAPVHLAASTRLAVDVNLQLLSSHLLTLSKKY